MVCCRQRIRDCRVTREQKLNILSECPPVRVTPDGDPAGARAGQPRDTVRGEGGSPRGTVAG
eukprot:3909201-Prymnesium_polylepis.2